MMTIKKNQKGFTLIELMIVVAIIGILAAIAVPNFIAYRNKAKVAAGVATASSIRGAMAGYAADSVGNMFPEAIADWAALAALMNANGATLDTNELTQGFSTGTMVYTSIETPASSGIFGDYTVTVEVAGVPEEMVGKVIVISPSGLIKQT